MRTSAFFDVADLRVKVHVALGHSYLLAARLYSTCCDAGSLLAASLYHAEGPFPASQGFSVAYFLQYLLQTRFQNV